MAHIPHMSPVSRDSDRSHAGRNGRCRGRRSSFGGPNSVGINGIVGPVGVGQRRLAGVSPDCRASAPLLCAVGVGAVPRLSALVGHHDALRHRRGFPQSRRRLRQYRRSQRLAPLPRR